MIKSFFYSNNKFQPVYFWITLFCLLIALVFIQRIVSNTITTIELISMLGFIQIWIALYNINKKSNKKSNIDLIAIKGSPEFDLAKMEMFDTLKVDDAKKDKKPLDIENEEPKL